MKTKIRNAGVSATATKARRAVLTTMFFLFGAVIVCACSFASEEENERQELVEVGQKLPAFAVVMNDSTLVSSTDLTGKPSMIVFSTRPAPIAGRNCQSFKNSTRNFPTASTSWQYHALKEGKALPPIGKKKNWKSPIAHKPTETCLACLQNHHSPIIHR